MRCMLAEPKHSVKWNEWCKRKSAETRILKWRASLPGRFLCGDKTVILMKIWKVIILLKPTGKAFALYCVYWESFPLLIQWKRLLLMHMCTFRYVYNDSGFHRALCVLVLSLQSWHVQMYDLLCLHCIVGPGSYH